MHRILLVLVIPGFLALCGVPSACEATATEGSAPALVAPALDGKTFDLSLLKGKVIIVHFWATWCGACREEMPVLDDFYLRHHAQGVEVIGVSVDSKHDRDGVIAYMRGFHFPASLISDAKTNSFGMPAALPVTYVLDTQGIVRKMFTPDKTILTPQILDNAVLPLIP